MPTRSVSLFMSAVLCAVLFIPIAARAAEPSQPSSPNSDPLVQLLLSKGVLTSAEAEALRCGTAADNHTQLLKLLHDKGVLSATDYDSLTTPPASSQVSTALVASTTPMVPATQTAVPTPQPAKPEAPKVIPAVAPLRVLQLEPSRPDGMIPDLKLGSGARLKLYGMVKASLIYDSSSPYGTDMPLPGFITASGTAFDPGSKLFPSYRGVPAREWHDFRSGFGSIFTF